MKQIPTTVPDNCELKQDGNTYTIVEKEKKLTYEDVARKLFKEKLCYLIDDIGDFAEIYHDEESCWNYRWNATSKKQLEKLLAINMLMNVAKYLNGDWQPDWNDYDEYKYYIYYKNMSTCSRLRIDYSTSNQNNFVYFKSVALARQAIEILGEETIKLALCTDY